jgi:hypothetical protein
MIHMTVSSWRGIGVELAAAAIPESGPRARGACIACSPTSRNCVNEK